MMTYHSGSQLGRLRMAAAALLLVALAACATPFKADVSRFTTQLPAPTGQSFAVVADDPKLSGGLEFNQYASLVRDRMVKLGYTAVDDPAQATLIVRFDYGVDNGRERVRSTNIGPAGPWGPWGYGGFYGRSWGGWGGSWGGPWRYGWYDPFFDNSIQSYTIYTSGIGLKIDRAVDGQRLFEGKAEAVSTSNRLQYLVPNLIEAMFTNFPGNSGETVRITVAPENK
ncbi:protein of unknown function [Novosphingobium panipatense]|uniref:DUF4136 domain-containing protein n=2 Tax=Novosphingobium panipatense TaxID=428991 RepID=A0ABY1QFX1_9SPHN|nr:protein of unknown function [Novosphingobium panipatense]